jgi:hypothetical protein
MPPDNSEGAHVVITLDAIYRIALETRDDVREVKQQVIDLVSRGDDHETRIRSLERRIYWASGFAAAFASAITALVGRAVGF